MDCEYVREYYNVPAQIGRRVIYNGNLGTIYKDGGNYIAVNFDTEKAGHTHNIHPEDEKLEYLGIGKIRKMTRSQQRYRDYLDADCGLTFAEWIGVK